ncbi:MAG: LPP20 family lipoprotein [Bacteroidales bacterium]
MRKAAFIVWVFMILGCGTEKDLAKQRRDWPEWAKRKPVTEGYYTGIGSAPKTANIDRYKQIARQNALNNLAGEISVTVSGRSVLHTVEVNYNLSEYFSSRIITSSEEELEGYELVDTFEDADRYFVYYRLSRSLFEKIKRERMEKAMDKAKTEWKKAMDYRDKGAYRNALVSQVKGLHELRNFLNEPLKTTLDDREVYLGNALVYQIQYTLDNIRILPSRESIVATRGYPVTAGQLRFRITDSDGRPLGSVPVKAGFTAQSMVFDQAVSDPEGYASFRVEKLSTRSPSGEFRVSPDLDKILQSATSDLIVRRIVRGMQTPSAVVNIRIREPVFHVTSTEQNLGKPLEAPLLKEAFVSALLSEGYQVAASRPPADFFVEIRADTEEKSRYNRRYKTILTYSITVRDKAGAIEFSKVNRGIEGEQVNFQSAGLGAYEQGAAEIRLRDIDEVMYHIF